MHYITKAWRYPAFTPLKQRAVKEIIPIVGKIAMITIRIINSDDNNDNNPLQMFSVVLPFFPPLLLNVIKITACFHLIKILILEVQRERNSESECKTPDHG